MTDTDTEARMACPTPAKKKYATLSAADIDRVTLGSTRGRDLEAYDTCPCGWVHLATKREIKGVGAEPMTVEDILALDHDTFNKLVRRETYNAVHPDTAESLRNPRLAHAWVEALKLFRMDLNIQRQDRSGERSLGHAEWSRRLHRVMLSTVDRLNEAQRIVRDMSHLKVPRVVQLKKDKDPEKTAVGCLDIVLATDDQLDEKVTKMVAGELAIEKLKAKYLDEYIYLCALEYTRFKLPLTKAMKITLEHFQIPEQRTNTEENE